jgi:hypothetical protein
MLQELPKFLLKNLLFADPMVRFLQFEKRGHKRLCHIAPAVGAEMPHGIGI